MGLGFLRFLLSLMVIDQHYGAYRDYVLPYLLNTFGIDHLAPIGEGAFAVTGFFVLSGYLIAHVLRKRHQLFETGPWSPWTFYIERALRIYPTYCLVLLLTYLAYRFLAIAPTYSIAQWFNNLSLIPFGVDLLGASSQATFGLSVGSQLLLPQAWTVTLDLCFYLAAPFILRNLLLRRTMLIAGACAILLAQMHINNVPSWYIAFYNGGWIYWTAFLAGAELQLSERVPGRSWALAGGLYVLYAAYLPWGLQPVLAQGLAIPAFLGVIGHIGARPAPSHLDRFFGEITYAVYLLQLSVWNVVKPLAPVAPYLPALFATTRLAIAVSLFFERPMDRHRHRWARLGGERLSHLRISRTMEKVICWIWVLVMLGLLGLTLIYHWLAFGPMREATCRPAVLGCVVPLSSNRVTIINGTLPIQLTGVGIHLQSCAQVNHSRARPACIPARNDHAIIGIFYYNNKYIVGINSYQVRVVPALLNGQTVMAVSGSPMTYSQWPMKP